MCAAQTLVVPDRPKVEGLSFNAVARDVAKLGTGTMLATIFNVLLIFLIPRLVSVEAYGYWRLFLLYSGYAGILHLGLVDGALLRWAGRPLADFEHEILPSMKFLFWQHIGMILLGAVALEMFFGSEHRFVGIAVLLYALLINATTLLQFGLQSARMFTAVAVSTASPLGIFLVLVFLCEWWRIPNFKVLILFYLVASAAVFAFLFGRLRKHLIRRHHSGWEAVSNQILLGWPVLVANTGMCLVQSADRVVLSWQSSIQDFAIYSLAASGTMTVVLAVVVAAYRVFFPHLAALGKEQSREVYASASRFLFLCWVLLLPYYFVLEAFVNRFLPRYTASLPIARILLLGTIFLGQILVLHTSFAYLHGKQMTFLSYTLGAVVFTFLIVMAAALVTRSLWVIALAQVTALGAWWFFDEWKLREITGQMGRQWAAALGLFCWAAACYWLAFHEAQGLLVRMAIYYGLVAFVAWPICKTEIRLGMRFLMHIRTALVTTMQRLALSWSPRKEAA